MKNLFVTANYGVEGGGPSKFVHDLSKYLSRKGIDVDILTTYKSTETLYPIPAKVNLIKAERGILNRFWFGFSLDVYKFLKRNINRYDIIHIYELWHFPHFVSFLMHKNIPYVVSVAGGLSASCLNHKMIKKKIFSLLIQKKILSQASTVRVTSFEEKQSLINYYGKPLNNIIEIPNGLDLEEYKKLPKKNSFKNKYSLLQNNKYILFLGRINFVKGLDILVETFRVLSKEYKDLYLVIAGPDSEGYESKVRKWLNDKGIYDRVIFTGLLTGREKLSAYVDSEIFVLPSYSENFGMAVVEAMACGAPVVISNKVGIFSTIEENNAGIVTKTNSKSLYSGIKALLDDDSFKKEISENGKKLVRSYYNIDKIANMMIKAYEQVLQ